MDERSINGAAIEAISDLELDCEIKEVCQPSGKDEWCIQFSGKYGQFCDEFKNQFGEENSPPVIREKIKSHLLKQVTKIRSSTGRRRAPKNERTDEARQRGSDLLTAPVKLIGEMLGRASDVAGDVINQASSVAETARAAVSAMTPDISPVPPATPAARHVAQARPEAAKKASPARKRVHPAKKKSSGKTAKARKRASGQKGRAAKKAAKKAGQAARKSSGRKTAGPKKAKRR